MVLSTSLSSGLVHQPFIHPKKKFRLKRITGEEDMYDYFVGALPRTSVHLVVDLLKHLDEARPYSVLKEKLLSSQELDDVIVASTFYEQHVSDLHLLFFSFTTFRITAWW
jgi:hypothetical protein